MAATRNRLSSHDLSRVLDAVAEFEESRCLAEFARRVTHAAHGLARCEFAVLHMVYDDEGRLEATSWPPGLVSTRDLPPAHYRHPFTQAEARAGGVLPATRISDLWPDHKWLSSSVYREGRAFGALQRQLAIGGHIGPVGVGLTLTRDGREFSTRDRAVLDAIRPHVWALFRQARRLEVTVGIQTQRTPHLETSDHIGTDLLTPRERIVLQLTSEGLTSAAVGHRLGVSVRTVEKHLEHLYGKLRVHDRASAVRIHVEGRLHTESH